MNILLTGASGLLGSALQRVCAANSVICTPLARPILKADALSNLVEQFDGFDVLIHAAANTNVEQCESLPDDCYRDNFLLTELLATSASLAGVKTIFISSTGVYGDGQKRPYCEYDNAAPTTHHHRSKLLAEQRVLQLGTKNLVLRTGWLFGGNSTNPKNFVARRIEEAQFAAENGFYVESNIDQRGVPCHSDAIATRLLELAASDAYGTLNCVNNGNASRYEYVCAIAKMANIQVNIHPVKGTNFDRTARVSNNEMATNWGMQEQGWPPMPHWQDSLSAYISTITKP